MKKSLLLFAFAALLCNLSAQQFQTLPYSGSMIIVPSPSVIITELDSVIPGARPVGVIDSQNTLPPQWWAFPLEKTKPKYKATNTKLIGWSVCAWAGLVDGVLEGYGFDGRRSFERKFDADPNGYFGSRSWAKAYPDKNPQNPIKPASKVFGAWDFYHHADKMRKFSYLSGGVVVGIGGAKSNQKWWHYAVDFGVSFAVSGATKAAGMYWVRN